VTADLPGDSAQVAAALSLLEARRAQLEEEIERGKSELADLSVSIGSLRAIVSGHAGVSTQEAARAYYEALPPGTRISVPECLAHMEANGWRSPAIDRYRALSTFLAREAGKGLLRKGARSDYFTL
jgi:hypothetical protein